jgi:uncharacterized protein YidB (DUF937 family)
MGLLDSLFSDALGSASGMQGQQSGTNPLGSILASLGGGNQQQTGNLLAAAMSMLQQNGGLGGVLGMFQRSGLGAQADSWVGTGANMAVSGDQLQQVFGGSTLGNIASQLGMQQGHANSAMAQILPELINQLTPGGQVPDNAGDLISRGLSAFRAGA